MNESVRQRGLGDAEQDVFVPAGRPPLAIALVVLVQQLRALDLLARDERASPASTICTRRNICRTITRCACR